MILKEYVSGKSATDVVFKKDRLLTFNFDLNSEVLSIVVEPRLILAHGAEKQQASVNHVMASVEVAGPQGYAIQVPEASLAAFNTLKNDIANKVAKFYEDHILRVEEA